MLSQYPGRRFSAEEEDVERQPRAELEALDKTAELAEALDFVLRVDEPSEKMPFFTPRCVL